MTFVIKVDQEEECVPVVLDRLGNAKFIRVDGHSGAGKSRIAKALAAQLGWKRIETDKFLDGKPRGRRLYRDMVDMPRLHEAIAEHQSGGIILDGIWSLALVADQHFGPEFKIYMRSFAAPEFDGDETRRRAQFGTTKYHRLYDPARWADLIVLKIALFPVAAAT